MAAAAHLLVEVVEAVAVRERVAQRLGRQLLQLDARAHVVRDRVLHDVAHRQHLRACGRSMLLVMHARPPSCPDDVVHHQLLPWHAACSCS